MKHYALTEALSEWSVKSLEITSPAQIAVHDAVRPTALLVSCILFKLSSNNVLILMSHAFIVAAFVRLTFIAAFVAETVVATSNT